MTAATCSINRACAAAGTTFALLTAGMLAALHYLTGNPAVFWCGLLFSALLLSCAVLLLAFVRRELSLFSDRMCRTLDEMMTEAAEPAQAMEDDSLFDKISHRLARLYEVMREARRGAAKERADLQELISDISHQVKTPVANLKMVTATLLEQPVPLEKQRDFLRAMEGQIDKLDFLIQAMVKTSRLETGAISLEKKRQTIYDTLASAMGGILLGAEKKGITVSVSCSEEVSICHDRKWTSEALFNILDNAVKYTPREGRIYVRAEPLKMYLKIDITDSGKGIPERHQGAIFRRFYREEDVHEIEGIGIGLYLAREIISRQGGYIRVVSAVGHGSTFSVFLPWS